MIDSQKIVYEHILHSVYRNDNRKRVIIVEGGPGTGKSVLAVNLLAKLIGDGRSASYVSKNTAPRAVYLSKLKGSMKKSRIDSCSKVPVRFTAHPGTVST